MFNFSIENINRQRIKTIIFEKNILLIEYVSGFKYSYKNISVYLIKDYLELIIKGIKKNNFQVIDETIEKLFDILDDYPCTIESAEIAY
ncbi:hypothetical protein [Cetobacterium sp. SF1]|uniref:hypothetical protein n=1 Tax=Cetobacterium sp. SF1 TaxID=3417654 RepID=UPI003CE8733E